MGVNTHLHNDAVYVTPTVDDDGVLDTFATIFSVGLDLQQMFTGVAEIDGFALPPRTVRHAWALHIADGPWTIPIGNTSVFDALKDRLELIAVHGKSRVVPQ